MVHPTWIDPKHTPDHPNSQILTAFHLMCLHLLADLIHTIQRPRCLAKTNRGGQAIGNPVISTTKKICNIYPVQARNPTAYDHVQWNGCNKYVSWFHQRCYACSLASANGITSKPFKKGVSNCSAWLRSQKLSTTLKSSKENKWTSLPPPRFCLRFSRWFAHHWRLHCLLSHLLQVFQTLRGTFMPKLQQDLLSSLLELERKNRKRTTVIPSFGVKTSVWNTSCTTLPQEKCCTKNLPST